MPILDKIDVIVIGAGPIGLACGLELEKKKISYLIIEKGCLVNSIFNYPTKMTFFTYNYDITIGDIPFSDDPKRPTRNEALSYYRSIVAYRNLKINLYEEVLEITQSNGYFIVNTRKTQFPKVKSSFNARKIIIATGYFDNPNYLGIPGEKDSTICSHYYTDPHPYFNQNVVIIGGGNSAAEAALDLYRHNVNVFLIHRGKQLKKAIKYWVMPDIQGRIKEGVIKAYFNTTVKEIRHNEIIIVQDDKEIILKNVNFVFALTGYHPNYSFFRKIGLELNEENGKVKLSNSDTYESTVKGVYVVGSAAYGKFLNKIFIENGRFEAIKAVNSLSFT